MSDFEAARAEFDARLQARLAQGRLRPGNEPLLLHHGARTAEALVLIHGLSDSPYYMRAIGERFHQAGLNVVVPLLPAHGLVEPGDVFQDPHLAEAWRAEVDAAVRVAQRLGDRISLGGLSTGGALSVDKALRSPEVIDGGLFLFSAALAITGAAELVGKWPALARRLARPIGRAAWRKHGCPSYPGVGRNPYRYPIFPLDGALQLAILIGWINRELGSWGGALRQPVFAAHLTHDSAAEIRGIHALMARVRGPRSLLMFGDREIDHATLVLAEDIPFAAPASVPACVATIGEPERANPYFDEMMAAALAFFRAFAANNRDQQTPAVLS